MPPAQGLWLLSFDATAAEMGLNFLVMQTRYLAFSFRKGLKAT
jgi:hypothetical protein